MKKLGIFLFVCLCLSACSPRQTARVAQLDTFADAYLTVENDKQLHFDAEETRSGATSVTKDAQKSFRKEVLSSILRYEIETVNAIPEKGELLLALEIDEFRYNIAQNDRLSVYSNGIIRLHQNGKTSHFRLSENDTFHFVNQLRTLKDIFLEKNIIKN